MVEWPKWLSVRLRTKWLWVRFPLLSLKPANLLYFRTKIPQVFYDILIFQPEPLKAAFKFLQIGISNQPDYCTTFSVIASIKL